MALAIMELKKVQYYKLPFFMLINFLLKDDKLSSTLDFEKLKSLITNMYVYAFLFTNSGGSKNKTLIAYDMLDKVHTRNRDTIKEVLNSLKSIRNNYLKNFKMIINVDFAKVYSFYSIMDNFNSDDNFINKIYSPNEEYTIEHFLIHNNKSTKVNWKEEGNNFTINMKELLGIPDGKTYKATTYKKQMTNYLILPKMLNETIKSDDIVSKIDAIRRYYDEIGLPKHIGVFIRAC